MVLVVKVNAWVAIIAYWPIAAAISLPILLLTGSGSANSPIAVLSPIFILVAMVWALIAHLRYALAPYVALFEPEVPIKQTLKRSQLLLKKGGQWFVFKGVLLLLVLFILIAVATGSNLRQLESSNDITLNILFITLSVLIEGALVMLYLNRTGKKDPVNAPKSLPLTAIALIILVALIAFSAHKGKTNTDNSAFSGTSISQADQAKYEKLGNDIERKVNMKGLGQALETHYGKNGFYPGESDIANPQWLSANLAELRPGVIVDPQGNRINSANSDYQYIASPEGCSKCASFELTANLEESDDYKQSSLNNTSNPGTNTTPTTSPSLR